MTVNLRQRLHDNMTIIGSWYSLTDPAAMELLSQSSFDFLLVDGEHTHIGEAHLPGLLRAAKGNHTATLYRVRENSAGIIKMALDLGVDGLFVPQVNDAAAAKRAVAAAKYPPVGSRGVGPHRVSNYYENLADYYVTANGSNTLILQIEHIDAVNALDEILAVPGYDALFIGPADLSASMGYFPDTGHPEVQAVIKEVVRAGVAAGIPVGIDAAGGDHIREMATLGVQIFTLGMDIAYLQEGAEATAAIMRAALNE